MNVSQICGVAYSRVLDNEDDDVGPNPPQSSATNDSSETNVRFTTNKPQIDLKLAFRRLTLKSRAHPKLGDVMQAIVDTGVLGEMGRPGIILTPVPTNTPSAQGENHQAKRFWTADVFTRLNVTKALSAIPNFFGTASYSQFDDAGFKSGPAARFSGDLHRNAALHSRRHTNGLTE